MMAARFCKVCRGWHDLDQPWPATCIPARYTARADLAAPMLITDCMTPVQSMLDGAMYDSKAKLRRTYKQAGMVEVGNEKPKARKPRKPDRKSIDATVEKALSRTGFGA